MLADYFVLLAADKVTQTNANTIKLDLNFFSKWTEYQIRTEQKSELTEIEEVYRT